MEYRKTPARLTVGKVSKGYETDIRDEDGNHVADIRGWGRIQYFENAEELQDKIVQFVVDAINEKLSKEPI